MGQSISIAALFFLICGASTFMPGCDEKPAPLPTAHPAPGVHTKIASLVPAATDLIIGMGAADHLVAVSNYDPADIDGRTLPRVGDYQGPAWEMIATLHPEVMIIQMSPDRLPAGFTQKAGRLGIQLLNVRLNTVADILQAIPQIGRAIGEPAKAEMLAKRLSDRLDAIRKKSARLPPVKTLLTLNETGETLVGIGTFLDDLLTTAGGQNAAATLGAAWPKADSEILMELKPDAVILLKPNASPEALTAAQSAWNRLPNIPAAKNRRIFLIHDPSVLLPGSHIADIAEELFQDLHSGGTIP